MTLFDGAQIVIEKGRKANEKRSRPLVCINLKWVCTYDVKFVDIPVL